jgi:hypothetical protein
LKDERPASNIERPTSNKETNWKDERPITPGREMKKTTPNSKLKTAISPACLLAHSQPFSASYDSRRIRHQSDLCFFILSHSKFDVERSMFDVRRFLE